MKNKIFEKTVRFVRDFFLPNRCPGCSRLIRWDKLLCKDCLKQLNDVSRKVCPVCGKIPCADHKALIPERVIVIYEYSGKCIDAIYSMKYRRGVNFAELGAQKLSEILLREELAQKADIVTCVPMGRTKKRVRGYNQAQLIGKYLSALISKPLDSRLLTHAPTLTEHHRLSAADRQENAKKSFYPSKKHRDITGKTVILCDDVYTTGATLNVCASCLKEMGAGKVIAVSIATTLLKEKSSEKQDFSEA